MDDSPADGLSPAARQAFVLLRQGFVQGLPQRWHEIETAGSGPALEAALHRLCGAAASYGLPALGEAARRAEQLVKAAGPHGDAPLAQALAELGRLIESAATVR